MPCPRRTCTSPGWVPAGISTSISPAGPGTASEAPSAACVIVSSTAVCRSSPSRSMPGCGRTCTWTKTSPAGPPSSPAWPSPRTRMRWPSAIPAGMSRSSARSCSVRPSTVTGDAWRLDDASEAVAARAGAGADELAEDALGYLLDASGAAAHVAGDGARSRCGAVAAARVARPGDAGRDADRDPREGLCQRDLGARRPRHRRGSGRPGRAA